MGSYDFIYGSKVIVQCQSQINIVPWKGDIEYNGYLQIIKKDIDYFTSWCRPRSVVKCIVRDPPNEVIDDDILEIVGTKIDDMLKEQTRALTWTTHENPEIIHVPGPGRGHGKQQAIFKLRTFCAKDKGINFNLTAYTSAGSTEETLPGTATK